MEPNRLRELLEATRDDAPDQGLSEVEALEMRELLADDPELQAELTRIGSWDRVVAAAAEDVPIPSGLADRLRTTVAQELSVAEKAAGAITATVTKPSVTRRHWLLAAVATAATVVLAVGLGTYLRQPVTIDVAELEREVTEITSDLPSIAWQPKGTAYPPASFPSQVRIKPLRWGRVATSLDRQAIIFDLVKDGAPRAVVVAMQLSAASSDLPSRPGLEPSSNTGNVCTGVWQHDDYAYALVVSGGKARYQLFLRDSGSVTANW